MKLCVRVDNMIRLPRAGAPEGLISKLKDAFEHDNPERAAKEAMGIFAANVPRRIATWRSTGDEFLVPRGGMGRLRALLVDAGIPYRVEDARTEGSPTPDFPRYIGHPLRWYQEAAVEKILEIEQGIIRAPTGCLSGATIVELNRAGKSFQCDLARLVKMHGGGTAMGKVWDPQIPTRIRMRDADGFIRLGTLVDAYSSGRRETFEVMTASGNRIRATMDHRFMTPTGWKRLREIACGDEVLIDGGVQIAEKKTAKQRYRVVNGLHFHPHAGRKGVRPGKGGVSVSMHRLVMEASLSGVGYAEFVRRIRLGRIAGLTFLDPKKFSVHHVDEDPLNNARENLVILSHVEHSRQHGIDGGWQHVTARSIADRIVSISAPRIEETFDVEVEEAEHNFLANGFVVHNSGKTTLAFAAIARVGLNAIVILPNKGLFKQWANRAKAELGLSSDQLGTLGGGKAKRLRPVTIAIQATLWSMADRGELDEVLDYFGHVIFDEAQLAAARTVNETVEMFPARYRIAISADERRKDRKEFLTHDQFGDRIYEVSRREVEKGGHVVDVAMLVVPTEFRAPWYGISDTPRTSWLRKPGGDEREIDFNRLLDEMTADDARNELALRFAHREVEAGEQCIMLTGRREHARTLDRFFVERRVESGYLLGEQEAGDASEFDRTVRGLLDGSVRVGIGTYKALGVGIDLPAVAAGVAVTPIASNPQQMNQVRGRLCRPAPGKGSGRLYMLWDRWVYPRHLDTIIANNKTVRVWDGSGFADARAWRRRNKAGLVRG